MIWHDMARHDLNSFPLGILTKNNKLTNHVRNQHMQISYMCHMYRPSMLFVTQHSICSVHCPSAAAGQHGVGSSAPVQM